LIQKVPLYSWKKLKLFLFCFSCLTRSPPTLTSSNPPYSSCLWLLPYSFFSWLRFTRNISVSSFRTLKSRRSLNSTPVKNSYSNGITSVVHENWPNSSSSFATGIRFPTEVGQCRDKMMCGALPSLRFSPSWYGNQTKEHFLYLSTPPPPATSSQTPDLQSVATSNLTFFHTVAQRIEKSHTRNRSRNVLFCS
jgi:hypothetical protein